MMAYGNRRYQVLLVDDEPIILRSLKVAVPWDELGMEVAGEAANGLEAARLVETIDPDIILCDIRMPVMDGIELIRKLASQKPERIFIILSGYGEFDYAREALRHGAYDYMLKPIDHEELTRVLGEARKKLDASRAQRQEVEYLRRSFQSLSSLVRERMLFAMIEGTDEPFRSSFWLDHWEIESGYRMIVIRLDNYAQASRIWDWKEKRLWFFAIQNILKEYGEQSGSWTVFPFHGGEWVMIYLDQSEAEIKQKANEIVKLIQKYTNLSCSAGVSRPFEGLGRLHESYESAKRALHRRFVSSDAGVFCDDDENVTAGNAGVREYPLEIEKKLVKAVSTLDEEGMMAEIERLHHVMSEASCTREQGERIFLEMLTAVQRQFEQRSPKHLFRLEPYLERLSHCVSLNDMVHTAKQALGEWINESRKRDREDGTESIRKALEYIENRYHHDLGIDEVAEYCGLSSSHFCVLFRQVVGQTFLEYLTRFRIDKACSILRNSEVKVYQVAPLVGYMDSRYFTQVFKKVVGMTPSEYRQTMLESRP